MTPLDSSVEGAAHGRPHRRRGRFKGPLVRPVSDPARAWQVDEPDYDARLGAYAELVPGAWADLGARRAPPLLHAALADLRRPEDLALRHAASQARRPAPVVNAWG